MSGELRCNYPTSGATLTAEIVHPLDGTLVWNGTAFAAYSSMNLATWRAALVAVVEQALSSAEKTCLYVGDKPAAVPFPCSVRYRVGAAGSALPADTVVGQQELTDTDLVDVGNVVADGSNSTTTFETNLTGASASNYIGRLLILSSGNGVKEPRRITGFDTGTKFLTVSVALSGVPTSGAAFAIVGMIEA